ncbi:MAG: VWA domain-containing protein [Proteobacteria bacterium]|nr:VWA domain-containing protein [Pseudomonadota bacterium]MBU4010157.1 VWA domain-containing protein [Pseudomonadota bacterium]
MTFAHLWILHFLWLLPVIGLLLIFGYRQKKKALNLVADPDLLVRLAGRISKGRIFVKAAFLICALGIMIFALAGPRWGSHYQDVTQKGVDIMILVDVSPSMMVEDIKPNRLERARREMLDFLNVVQGDRIGLVAFSGIAFVQCPLTLDYGAIQMFLDELKPELIPVAGTDLGAAIETGISSFDFKSSTDKVIILITDGEDNEERGLIAAQKAKEKDVKIFVFGMGDTSGGPIPAIDGTGGFRKDRDGNVIMSKMDEESLKKIALVTGGRYTRSVTGDLDLDLIYFDGIKSLTTARTLKSGKIKVYEERFSFFLSAAFLLLILEALLIEREKIKN